MTDTNLAGARYLHRLRSELAALPAADRDEIVREIQDHLADATASGKPLDEALSALGPAEALARAYAVELALNPRRTSLGRMDRALTVLGLLAVASLPSFVICVVLFAVGVAFTASGFAVFVAGIAALVRPELVPDLTVQPWLCFVIGPPLAAAGLLSLGGLYLYGRFIVRLTMKTLERVRQR